jgi:hypothetical protein
MIPIYTIFGGLTVMFAVIGSLRGWAKESIVSFSVILALFFEHVLLAFGPTKGLFNGLSLSGQFGVRAIVFLFITISGYAGPTFAARLQPKIARERLQDVLLGFFLGLINGFLIIGTLLSFLNAARYGVEAGFWNEVPKVDETGQPIMDEEGKQVMETVYRPGAEGIGGIVPPEPDSPTSNLIGFLPPEMVEKSDLMLYFAVAVSFIFVIVVFI